MANKGSTQIRSIACILHFPEEATRNLFFLNIKPYTCCPAHLELPGHKAERQEAALAVGVRDDI